MSYEIRNESHPVYSVSSQAIVQEDIIIQQALEILEGRLKARHQGISFSTPSEIKHHAKMKLAALEYEIFGCYFLNNQHQLIAFEEIFRGTIDGAAVYPREVVKRALASNSCAVIFFHIITPSGITRESQSDVAITKKLKDALGTGSHYCW